MNCVLQRYLGVTGTGVHSAPIPGFPERFMFGIIHFWSWRSASRQIAIMSSRGTVLPRRCFFLAVIDPSSGSAPVSQRPRADR
jgi:hypothetical protein